MDAVIVQGLPERKHLVAESKLLLICRIANFGLNLCFDRVN